MTPVTNMKNREKYMELIDSESVESINWPDELDKSLIKNYFAAMMKKGTSHFIANINTTPYILRIGSKFLPITVNDTEYANSYVTSIYSYIPYLEEEVIRLNKTWLYLCSKPILNFLSFWFKKSHINRIVTVNNFLLSTNIYIDLTFDELSKIHTFLLQKFPSHSLLFRSLNNRTEAPISLALKTLSYDFLTARSVYFFDPKEYNSMGAKSRWQINNDAALFKNHDISIIEHKDLKKSDISKIKSLYDMLYIEKYSGLNPQFTEAFFEHALDTKSFHLQGISFKGELVGVVGFFLEREILVTPIVGYDTSLPIDLGLYRMLIALVIRESLNSNQLFHLSAGVGHFKRHRGARQEFESIAVYHKHLSLSKRLPWYFLKFILNKIAAPLLKKNKL